MVFKYWLLSLYLVFGIRLSCASNVKKERSISTSVPSMMELLETERLMLKILKNYAKELEEKLEIVMSKIEQMHSETTKYESDAERYVSNPVNAFSLIRRMHTEWLEWELYLKKPIGLEQIRQASDERTSMPTEIDLKEAATAFSKVQMTYNLQPKDMASGLLNGKQYDARFSALDLYALGLELLKQNFSENANDWLHLALEAYSESKLYNAIDFSKRKIYELYAETFLEQYDFRNALKVLDEVIALDPSNVKLLKRKADIEFLSLTEKTPKQQTTSESQEDDYVYFSGCRGEFPLRPFKLQCRYKTNKSAFLNLAPIKMEEVSLDPYMVLFHDIITDNEIQTLKNISQKKLTRALVVDKDLNADVPSDYRTAQMLKLKENATALIQILDRRVKDMTGLRTEQSEILQIINYGLGGFYKDHWDYFNFSMDDELVRESGDRKATILFYMSDVEQGGSTVFPEIKVAISPQKGSVLMWFNLNNRGDPDPKTLHAACPVLVGTKWIATKWIREKAQFRACPCLKV